MSLWRQITRGVRVLTRRSAAADDVDDEVRHYFEETISALVARGLSPDEARRAARLELGTMTAVSEDVRSYGWEHAVSTAIADLRYGLRRLRATPGFTVMSILTLAIGIGGTTNVFGAVNRFCSRHCRIRSRPDRIGAGRGAPNPLGRLLTAPLPCIGASRSDAHARIDRRLQAVAAEHHRRRPAGAADWSAVARHASYARRRADHRTRLRGGRRPAAPASRQHSRDGLWRRRFAGDAAIVGRQIRLDGDLYTVIGIMPAGFESVLAPDAGLWAPLQYDPSLPRQGREWGHHLRTIGRLRAGVRVNEAALEMHAIGRTLLAEQRPDTYDPNTQFGAAPLQDELTRSVRPALFVILGAVTLVLLIACVNVTNLLLARGVQRRGEFALRAALGAGRTRLTRQLLTESLLLAAFGGAAGLAVAALGVRALVALVPPGLPRAGAIGVNGAVFGFGFCITTLIGLAVGLIPAQQAVRSDPHGNLQHGSRQTAGHARARRVLVVAEIALALVLLTSSGLLLRSMERLFAVPAGFEPSGLITMQVQVVGHRFDEAAATYRFFDEAREAARRLPGVIAAGFTSQLPMSGDRDEYGARFEATPALPAATYGVYRYAVSPGYLEAMGISLRRGRLLDEHDNAGAPLVALVSDSLANHRFRGQDPIGQRLRIGPAGPFTIVGVVGDVKQLSLALTDSNAVYLNVSQGWFASGVMSLVVRAHGDAKVQAPAVRQAIWSVDKDQPIARVPTLENLLAASAAERRFALILFEAFAIAALVLAAAGIYGVLAGGVAERTREIGVRSALGASRAEIVGLVVRQGMTLTFVGMAIGLAGAGVASRAIVAMLFGVSALDPATYVGVVGLLAAVSAFACAVPAWRATQVDPAITLRAE